MLGLIDVICKKDHFIWRIAESTKVLNKQNEV
jgi:hypothetical protein